MCCVKSTHISFSGEGGERLRKKYIYYLYFANHTCKKTVPCAHCTCEKVEWIKWFFGMKKNGKDVYH